MKRENRDDPVIAWRNWAIIGTCSLIVVAGAVWRLYEPTRMTPGGSTLTTCKSNLKNIGTALEMYSTNHQGKYPPSMDLLTPNYLKTIPECPAAGSITYRVTFGLNAPMNTHRYNEYYYLECHGNNHRDKGVIGDYPAYNGTMGLVERAP